MTYDKSKIMRHAWEIYRTVYRSCQTRRAFAAALREAWQVAKWDAREATKSPKVIAIERDIAGLQAKDFWSQADYALNRDLHAQLREAA